jgi:hypothetical protein
MCMDFIDLNKCCPKDNFPLARIDQVVDTAARSEMMALLDCFWGYHQIWLCKEDEEKTSFITPFGTYCYLRMPKGLGNPGPTLCRMTKAALKHQVGRNVLSYVNDIVVHSKKKKENYIPDLVETFTNIHNAILKLNPEKCIFGITRGESPRLFSFNKRHQSKPRQDQGHHPNATFTEQKRHAEAHRPDSIAQSIHIEACRMQLAFLRHTQMLRKSRMGRRIAKSLR